MERGAYVAHDGPEVAHGANPNLPGSSQSGNDALDMVKLVIEPVDIRAEVREVGRMVGHAVDMACQTCLLRHIAIQMHIIGCAPEVRMNFVVQFLDLPLQPQSDTIDMLKGLRLSTAGGAKKGDSEREGGQGCCFQ